MISEVVRSKGKKVSCAVYDDYSERAVSERLQPRIEWLKSGLIDRPSLWHMERNRMK